VRVAILLYDGFDELDAVGPYEVLRNAARGGVELTVELVTREPAERVTAGHGLAIEPQGVLDSSYDLVIVPGGGWSERAETGARGEAQRGDLPAAIRRARDGGATVASVCTGAMLLAAAGLTHGRRATTHRSALGDLKSGGAEVVEERVVDDGDLITAGGVTAGIDMALWLVERHYGRALADAIAREMEHERRGAEHRGAVSEASRRIVGN
jgi:transcriptional regulator GlxA family with amidase domain